MFAARATRIKDLFFQKSGDAKALSAFGIERIPQIQVVMCVLELTQSDRGA
jgi:hypothetical protein